MRVLVCGGRYFLERAAVFAALDELRPEIVIQGGAGGADKWARDWADEHGVPCVTMHAAWRGLSKSAGPIRNRWMLDYLRPDVVVALPGGAGTEDMVSKAFEAGVPVMRFSGDAPRPPEASKG